jgi:alpha-tubulin suppressor-like RCC1 family protein
MEKISNNQIENNNNNNITESILCIGNNSNGCFLKDDIEDCLIFTEIKNNLLKIYSSYKIKTGLKSCVLYNNNNNNKKNEEKKEFFLWGKFFNEEEKKNEENNEEEKNINRNMPLFSYKTFTLKNSIKKISIGENHLVLLDNLGYLYSMGKGLHGELGLGKEKNKLICNTPLLINFSENEKIVNCFTGIKSSFAVSCILIIYNYT